LSASRCSPSRSPSARVTAHDRVMHESHRERAKTMHAILTPLATYLDTVDWTDVVQLVSIGVVSWLGGHAVTRGELR